MVSPFLLQPGMRGRETFLQWDLIWLSTDVWDDITKGHNKHTGSVGSNVILSCDCEKGLYQFEETQ